MKREFADIYAEKRWHATIGSGPGSDPDRVAEYVRILNRVIREHGVRTVADLGCGDWSFSSQVDWSGVEYVGVEVVPEVVEGLNRRHARPGVRFVAADLTRDPLPHADLALVKDVLQHWPNRSVVDFLPRLNAYPLVLVTNDSRLLRRRWWHPFWFRDAIPANVDTTVGGYRPLRLRERPFGVSAEEADTFEMREGPFLFVKEVLLLKRTEGDAPP